MKKIALIGIIISITNYMYAQNDLDALRASRNNYGGTARFQGMSGAFGSLGGDFTSISINPAGLGVYRSAELSFTPSLYNNSFETTYLGSKSSDFDYNFNINSFGYVGRLSLNKGGWESLNFGIGFNRLNNFHENGIIETPSAQGSLLDEFVEYSNNGLGNAYYEDLAWFTEGIFVYDPNTFDTYIASDEDIPPGLPYTNDFKYYADADGNNEVYGHLLSKEITRTGKLSEFVISGAGNYKNKFYIGASVGIQRLRFEEQTIHTESTVNSDFSDLYDPNERFYFQSFDFRENTLTYGTGFNFKIGAIYRPIEYVRLGASLHTPTIFGLETEFSTSMDNSFYGGSSLNERSELAVNEFRVITPLKAVGSLGFQFGKIGLLSFDYEYVDYSKMKMRSDEDSFTDINEDIENIYTVAHNLRGGAEVRLGPVFLRGGAAYYGDPYDDVVGFDSDMMQFSGGIGLSGGPVKFDIGYVRTQLSDETSLYLDSPKAEIESTTNRFIATIAFRF